MTTIPGASRYLNASTLANTKGLSAQSTDLLSSVAGAVSLLNIGRGNAIPGIGLSAQSRELNRQFIENGKGNANGLFSATISMNETLENLQTQVLAIRARTPTSGLARNLLEIKTDDGTVISGATGQVVDSEA